MKTSSLVTSLACLSAGAILSTAVLAEDQVTPSPSERKAQSVKPEKKESPPSAEIKVEGKADKDLSKDADNTDRNKVDRDNATLTPGDQGKTKEDIEVTRQIRRALVKDKAMSTTAKNVKIITKDGAVTLRGPVKTESEKLAIVAKAKEVATAAHPITDELEVKSQTEIESKYKSSEPEAKDK